jgi:hypothetical protein
MPRTVIALLVLSACLACLARAADLEGWRFVPSGDTTADRAGTWSFGADGTVRCSGEPTGYLISPAEYEQFELSLQWRWPDDAKGGNSGVLVSTIPGLDGSGPWPLSFEVQLAQGRAGDIYALGLTTGFKTARPVWKPMGIPVIRVERAEHSPDPEKPAGQWNTLRLRFAGGILVVFVNGVEVNRLTEVKPTRGKIALQSEGAPLAFRNVRVTSPPPLPGQRQ